MKSALVACALMFLAVSGPAYAVTYYGPGVACVGQRPSDVGLGYAVQGYVYNESATVELYARCPVLQMESNTQDVDYLRIDYLDQNTNTGFSPNVWCAPYMYTESGSLFVGTIKYACSTAGGCTTEVPTFSGSGYIDWGNIWSSTASVRVIQIGCALPRQGTGVSSLYSYRVQLVGN